MNIDFSLLLVIGVFVTGLIWGVDRLYFAKQRLARAEQQEEDVPPKEPILVEYSRFLFPVILIVLILRGFIAEPFRIPSGSMLPTLEIGDFILVSKFSYGIRLPVLHSKVIDLGRPERGDVIVFRYPENPSVDYIKRVIGVPGDEIGYYNKVLYINGKAVDINAMGNAPDRGHHAKLRESLNGVEHDIMINTLFPAADFVLTVPPDKYFVMGDNRDNSNDSRVWGFVPDENLVGKAFLVWMSWKFGDWPQWGRIGTIIN